MQTLTAAKHEIIERNIRLMDASFPEETWTLEQKVALTCRVLFSHGHDSGLAGQITARTAEPDRYITQRMGLGFDEITCNNLLVVDGDLNVISGTGMVNPANRFHSWIYRLRPDVHCIVHTHPIHVSALCLLERPLRIAHMDSCMLYDEVAFLKQWPGLPVGNEEGELIAATLGRRRAAMLAHHGLVVAASTVEEACVMAVQIERTARMQLLAEAAGVVQDVDPKLAKEARDWILQPSRSRATFGYLARRVLRELETHPVRTSGESI
ncbi:MULTISPECIES: aldolase [unclassified Caballeronia]|uniref:aldolase n=1 Tax=unclassified Caballeronia TaxID=2646786 RepID=UPI0028662AE5|nr:MULTISPECIES: aldolase [unclassified Caballeronia]MDR5740579.1 aldolase [Caballeronia sp. LZ016]MDR5808899.1 aldolase [Caballeronia sp. LZ019]